MRYKHRLPPVGVVPFDVIVTFNNPYPFHDKDLTFSDAESPSVNETVNRWKAVWASDNVKTQLIHHKLDKTQHKSNQEVYDAIMVANPKRANRALTNVPNGSGTAITFGTITRLQQTWVRAKGGEKVNELVNTVAHEYTHTLEGDRFNHPYL